MPVPVSICHQCAMRATSHLLYTELLADETAGLFAPSNERDCTMQSVAALHLLDNALNQIAQLARLSRDDAIASNDSLKSCVPTPHKTNKQTRACMQRVEVRS